VTRRLKFLLLILALLSGYGAYRLMHRLGFFDPKIILVDEIRFERPFLYGLVTPQKQTIRLGSEGSEMIVLESPWYNNQKTYSVYKLLDKKSFARMIIASGITKKANVDQCYVMTTLLIPKEMNPKTHKDIVDHTILSYPYRIGIMSDEQQTWKNVLKQLCQNKDVIMSEANDTVGLTRAQLHALFPHLEE